MTKTAKDIAESRVDEACEVLHAFQVQATRRLERASTNPSRRASRDLCQALEQIAAAKRHLKTAEKTLKDVTP